MLFRSSKNIFVCFCVNSIFDLDRNLAISRADCLFHVYGKTLIDRGRFGAFFKGKDGSDRLKQLYIYGKKMYDYNKPKANFITTFTKEFVVDEVEYEKKKQIGVQNFLRGTEPKTTRAHKQRDVLIIELHDTYKVPISRIAELTSLTERAVYLILQKHRENGKS